MSSSQGTYVHTYGHRDSMTDPAQRAESVKKKWVDDVSLYVPIKLKDKLTLDTREQIIGHMLSDCNHEMHIELDSLQQYCLDSKMSIDQKKTRCMLFNRTTKHDFIPELHLNQDSNLEVVE